MMSKTAIDEMLFDLEHRAQVKYGCDIAERILAPLAWYIETSRCPTQTLLRLIGTNGRQRSTIVNRLYRLRYKPDAVIIENIKQYINAE